MNESGIKIGPSGKTCTSTLSVMSTSLPLFELHWVGGGQRIKLCTHGLEDRHVIKTLVPLGPSPPNRTATFCSSDRRAHQLRQRGKLVLVTGFEPVASCLTGKHEHLVHLTRIKTLTMYKNPRIRKPASVCFWAGYVNLLICKITLHALTRSAIAARTK